ncbi:transcriptional regulator [Paenibacillus timonensis]|uniref:Transcriptional regulator n=1 Tax=Paenibacillus timonensis TaxID=225915 RepID=A0ABW3S9S2_9BACL|nr:transcriptional regulator [Paenibacillus timonensis]MCH1639938.1 transcriptional regulator [Paenibacillus timonensis]
MNLNVAVIGPSDLVGKVVEVASVFRELTMIPTPYVHEQDTLEVVACVREQADILLFTGPIPYQLALDSEPGLPMVHVQYSGTAFFKVLFDFYRNRQVEMDGEVRISVDVLLRHELEEQLDELGLASRQIYVKSYSAGTRHEDLVAFHYDLWSRGLVAATVTCVTSVYQQLVELGVPAFRVVPTQSAIRDVLNRALLEGKNLRLSSTQMAIGILSIDHFERVVKEAASEYEIQRKKIILQQILIDFGEETQSLINWTDSNEVSFITTRGIIEQVTRKFEQAPLLLEVMERLQWKASIGIGLGRTANEAEGKAREALLKAKAGGGGNCFLMMQDGQVYGPMGSELTLKYSARSEDPELISMAKKAGLSVGTLNRLISLCRRLDTRALTAAQLAEGFGITLRSARRIMAALEKYELATIVGEEQPVGRGRPRQIYALHIDGFF